MQWWTWIWLLLIVWFTIGGAADDYRENPDSSDTGLGVVLGIICFVAVLAVTFEGVASFLGIWLAAISTLAGALLILEIARDIRSLSEDVSSVEGESKLSTIVGSISILAVFGSAVVAGLWTGASQW